MQATPAQFATKRGANTGSSKVRYFKKLLLCSGACRLYPSVAGVLPYKEISSAVLFIGQTDEGEQ